MHWLRFRLSLRLRFRLRFMLNLGSGLGLCLVLTTNARKSLSGASSCIQVAKCIRLTLTSWRIFLKTCRIIYYYFIFHTRREWQIQYTVPDVGEALDLALETGTNLRQIYADSATGTWMYTTVFNTVICCTVRVRESSGFENSFRERFFMTPPHREPTDTAYWSPWKPMVCFSVLTTSAFFR